MEILGDSLEVENFQACCWKCNSFVALLMVVDVAANVATTISAKVILAAAVALSVAAADAAAVAAKLLS